MNKKYLGDTITSYNNITSAVNNRIQRGNVRYMALQSIA